MAVAATFAADAEPLYSYDFATSGQLGEWTPYDANSDGDTWTVLQNFGARVYSFETNDDYLISPLLQLEAGVSYQADITFNSNSSIRSKLNVMYGTSLDGAGYTDAGAIDTTPGSTGSTTFTVPSSGEYRIALHETSDAFETIYIESVQITAIGGGGDTPAEVAEMPYSIDFSTTDWTGKWNASDLDGDGRTWGYNSDYSTDGYAQTRCNRNGTNDWLVSPSFHFEEGREYEITVLARQNSNNMASQYTNLAVKVMFGDQNYSPAKEIGTVEPMNIVLNRNNTFKFTADVTGDFPVSIVNASTGESIILNVANFSIVCTSGQGSSTELSLPYKYDFAANSIGDWSTLDANEDGITWQPSRYGASWGICCREALTINGDDDDYIVSPGTFALEQGKVYTATLSINGSISTVGDINKINLVYGTDDDFTAYQSAGSFKLDKDVQAAGTTTLNFSVSESGSYRIGLHNASSQAVWYITAIDIAEYSAPELPEGVLLDKDFNDGVDMGWTILDENADENPWQFVDGIDGISLPAKRGSQGNHNDWLISPAMTLEGGKAYVVSYTLAASTNSAPAIVLAAYGTDATAAAMTNTIAIESIENETVTHYYRITPSADGSYYLGFQANSAAGGNGTVSVVAVKVAESEGITPLAPTELTAEPSIKAGTVALSWTNPTMDTENIALDGNITLRIVRNGETVDDIIGQPGEQMSYTDRPTPFEGEASYQVVAYVDESRLSEAATATATLDDFQGERSELIFWGQHRNEDYTPTNYEPFSDWAVSDLDGNKSFTYQSWDNSFSLGMATSNNDWIISPAVELSTNRRYLIEVELQSSPAYGATLDVYMGTSASTAGMNTQLMQIDNATGNGWFILSTEQFDIDENGEYYFGIHCNARTQTTIYVHGFRIYYYENRDTDPEEVPYTEDFADADLAGWSFADGSTFAVADGALTSSQNGEPRSEIVYSPLINLKGGYTYEVTFDYAFDGADDGSTFTFYMADGQSETELIADSRLALDGTADGRCLFTPDEDGSYCLAWQIIAGADDDVKATIDNLAVGVNIYSALPYSEDFETYAINDMPAGYEDITTVSDADGNIAAEVANAGGSTLWFNYEELRETYSLTLKYKKSDFSGWEINAVTAEGEKQLVGSIEGDANADWKEVTFAIPTFDGKEEAYGFRLEFSTFGESSLLIDDLQITLNERAIAPAAPYNFRAYSNGTAAWNYPKTEADGYDLESATNVTVTIYDGDKELASSTGTPGSNGFIENLDFDDEWENDVKLIRATASVEGELGQSATWIIRKNDNSSWEYKGNILGIAEFDIDDKWQNNGWTIADGKATITEGEGSIVSPEFELKEGQIYLVRYYIDTDADAAADFSVKVGDASQTFTGARIGRNTYDWGGALPDAVGQYQYIDFVLPRIESTDDYNVTISAGNIGKSVSVDLVEIYEVREYPSTCEVPYENDFEDLAVELGGLEPNWSRPYYTNYWRIDDMSNYGATAASGNRALVAPATTDLDVTDIPEDFVYTPYFVIEAGKTYSIEFDYYMPSAQTGLAFIYAYTPTYTEGEYTIIEEMGQATEWKHYSKTFDVEDADGTLIFGFVSYAAEVRDQATAIDNFKITEESAPGSVSEIAADAAVTYHDGMLNVPADIESVAVYDMQGRMVISTTETGTISLEGLSDGVYVVKAVGTEGGAVQTLKIVK